MPEALPSVTGIPIDFVLFALVLAASPPSPSTLRVALIGVAVITAYKLAFTGFAGAPGLAGLGAHVAHEWVTLANLLLLLPGFALLARHFEDSRVPAVLPRFLPDDWKGGFVMLVLVFVLSSFLDNIAAAMVGGTMATSLYRGKVHVGFLAAIVAASNGGGAGSVLGDTTTTMMWIAGVPPVQVLEAYVAAVPALLVFGVVAARQQQALQPIVKHARAGVTIDATRLAIVVLILAGAVGANVWFNLRHPDVLAHAPVIGLAVWLVIGATVPWRRPDWAVLVPALRGAIFLLSLVLGASMMPVQHLPTPSWQTSFGLGFVSAVFDNIPLTALALHQGGYDWGFLAYAVGFGGSMIWFGSSAGVALASMHPQARSVAEWLRCGWHVALGYIIGFAILLLTLGWHPDAPAH
jgi:Na+/H+ antiporter NhaD/arsenite permease-like protein